MADDVKKLAPTKDVLVNKLARHIWLYPERSRHCVFVYNIVWNSLSCHAMCHPRPLLMKKWRHRGYMRAPHYRTLDKHHAVTVAERGSRHTVFILFYIVKNKVFVCHFYFLSIILFAFPSLFSTLYPLYSWPDPITRLPRELKAMPRGKSMSSATLGISAMHMESPSPRLGVY
jgi:hypothetical protein